MRGIATIAPAVPSRGILRVGAQFGPELVSNGDMEAGSPPTGWSWNAVLSTLSSVADPRTGSGGSKSLDVAITTGQTYGSAYVTPSAIQVGNKYRLSFWSKMYSGASYMAMILFYADWSQMFFVNSLVNTTWTQSVVDVVSTQQIATLVFYVFGSEGQHARLDDVSLRAIL